MPPAPSLARIAAALVLAGLAAGTPARGQARITPVQLTIRSRVVVRVETQTVTVPTIQWREKKGPRCLTTGAIVGAAVLAPQSVDFILRGGQRVRARFASSCPGLAFYSGFYVVPNPDGQMCVSRDAVRDRAGGECEVAKLRLLEAKR